MYHLGIHSKSDWLCLPEHLLRREPQLPTAGNGSAFLKLYARTADGRWLDTARRFAMLAIDHCERALTKFGQRKYSLWT